MNKRKTILLFITAIVLLSAITIICTLTYSIPKAPTIITVTPTVTPTSTEASRIISDDVNELQQVDDKELGDTDEVEAEVVVETEDDIMEVTPTPEPTSTPTPTPVPTEAVPTPEVTTTEAPTSEVVVTEAPQVEVTVETVVTEVPEAEPIVEEPIVTEAPVVSSQPYYDKALANRIVEIINEDRASLGLPALKTGDSQLQWVADTRATELPTDFSHNPFYDNPAYFYSAGENVGWHSSNASACDIFQAYKNSPLHYSLMTGSYEYIAVSAYYADGKIWTTMEFCGGSDLPDFD